MATAQGEAVPGDFDVLNKGLNTGALGLLSSTVVALASVAPAYSLAATLGFVVAAICTARPSSVVAWTSSPRSRALSPS